MNKKQLIVVWGMGIVLSILLFIGLGKIVRVQTSLRFLPEVDKWRFTPWSFLAVILIIGTLLIYTLRDKKK